MPSKKKSKPSFQVPEELQSAPQAGWVYRSDEQMPAKAGKPAPKTAAGGRAAAKPKHTESSLPTPETHVPGAAKPAPAHESKPRTAEKSDSDSKSSSAVIDMTAKVLSAGIGAAGGLVLVTTTLVAAPFALGKRILHL